MSLRKALLALLGIGLFASFSTLVAALAWALGLSRELQSELARVARLRVEAMALSTEVFDRNGAKIGEFSGERRYHVRLSELPQHVVQAFLSAEDKDFHHHYGISPTAIVRSAIANLRGGGIRQGASTITQQLARIYFLDQSRSMVRKLKEAMLALVIERHLSKSEILELYLNKIFLGNHSYGVEAAARNYFRKNAVDLSVGEAALLAALPKAPTRYAPHRHPELAAKRQALVLRRMAEDGFITRRDAAAWAKRPVDVAPEAEDHTSKAPYFIAQVQREMARKFESDALPIDGLRIYTTLDGRLQQAASAQLAAKLAAVSGGRAQIEGALVALDPRTGAVLAMQGGGDFGTTQFNRALDTRRRMGRLFMPVYLSLALERGYTLATSLGADPLAGTQPRPGAGPVVPTLYEALVEGLTMEGARLYAALGAGSVLEHARRLGLDFEREDMSVALGYGEATPMAATIAYAAFVNGGRVVAPYYIDRIENRHGKTLYQARRPDLKQAPRAMTPQTAFIMSQLLRDAVARGHADDANGSSPLVGGVSAATDDLHDAWFAGGLPTLAATVWIGSERGRERLAGSEELAADAAESLFAAVLRDAPRVYVERAMPPVAPPGVSFARYPADGRGPLRSLPFLSGTEPRAAGARF
jgi:penicillin-binding protein 1A